MYYGLARNHEIISIEDNLRDLGQFNFLEQIDVFENLTVDLISMNFTPTKQTEMYTTTDVTGDVVNKQFFTEQTITLHTFNKITTYQVFSIPNGGN